MIIVAVFFTGCDKTPDGVLNEDDMAHVLADFAKAEQLITHNPDMFPNDSAKAVDTKEI